MYDVLKEIPLIDTHVHRVHPEREPEFGQIAGGYIKGSGQEYHSRCTILYEGSSMSNFQMPTRAC